MKKRLISLFMISMSLISYVDVQACGEIKDLSSSPGTVKAVNETNYIVTVPAGTKEVTLSATTDYTWIEGYGPRKVSTTEGKVRLEVNGAVCGSGITTYFVEFKELPNVINEDNPVTQEPNDTPPADQENKDDNKTPDETNEPLTLEELNISEIDFEFDATKHVYNLNVENSVNKLTIDLKAKEGIATEISESADDLKEGNNTITINLKDQTGREGVYILNVKRQAAKSSNNYLSNLVIKDHQINFNSSDASYDVEIKDETSLNITATTENNRANTVILGNSNLADGSIVTVRVTAEDGTTRDYTINITRKFNIMDYSLYIAGGLLVLLLIIILLIVRKNKKKKNKKKKDGPEDIEVTKETAGEVKTVEQSTEVFTDTNISKEEAQLQSTSTLQIIEPTDVSTPVDEEKSPTEVFKL